MHIVACTKLRDSLVISDSPNPHTYMCHSEDFETKAVIDLGTKFKSAGTIYKKKFDMPGRALDLELLWKEKGSETEFGAVYKQDKQKKVSGK